jgi:hypothetical protein
MSRLTFHIIVWLRRFSKAGFVSIEDHGRWEYLLLRNFSQQLIIPAAAAAVSPLVLQVQQGWLCEHRGPCQVEVPAEC